MMSEDDSLEKQANEKRTAPIEPKLLQDASDDLRAAARSQVKLLQLLGRLVVEELNEKQNKND